MKKRNIALILAAVMLCCALSGCAAISSFFGSLTGELFGKDYDIRQYDNFGNLVFTVHGDR